MSVVKKHPVPATRVCLSLVCKNKYLCLKASGVVAILYQIICCCCCCRKKRKVFSSCCPPIRRSLVLHHPPLLPLRRSKLLLERCYMAQWALTPPHPPALSAVSSLNLLLSSPLPLCRPAPPQPQSPPIGRAVPLMGAHLSLLLLASRAPLSYLNNMTCGPSYAKGTLTSVT